MIRWIIHHLPDLACAMVALCNGFPVVLGGRTSLSRGSRVRQLAEGGNQRFQSGPPLDRAARV
jgi:hypothetical protein